MKRYYNENESNDENDPDENENEPFFGDDSEEGEVTAFIDQQALLDVMKMDVEMVKLNHELIEKATVIAKNSWFWSFHSAAYKMSQIELVYRKLIEMTAEDNTGYDSEIEDIDPEEFQEIDL